MPSPADLLPNLPSVNQLLEKPPVKVLLRRLKRSTVASGLTTYLSQLSEELPQRFASDAFPSPSEIADRAAKFILSLQTTGPTKTVINATGKLLGPEWIAPPLSEAAQSAMLEVAQGFVAAESQGSDAETRLLTEELCLQTGAEEALVLHSYETALLAALASLAAPQDVLVARSDVGRVGSTNVAQLVSASGCNLREVGAVDDSTLQHFEESMSVDSAAILSSRSDSYGVSGEIFDCSRDELVKFARKHNLPYINAMSGAPLRTLDDHFSALPAVEQSIQAGVDLVIVRGEGLVGGPLCGIILGKQNLVTKISQHVFTVAGALDPLRRSALLSTLKPSSGMSHEACEDIPVHRLINTSTENLQHRAGRLASQLAECELVEKAESVAVSSSLEEQGHMGSYGVVVQPKEGRQQELRNHLDSSLRPIHCLRRGESFLLDLRTVLPEEDRMVAQAFSGDEDVSSQTTEST